jgi:hypothetical protein
MLCPAATTAASGMAACLYRTLNMQHHRSHSAGQGRARLGDGHAVHAWASCRPHALLGARFDAALLATHSNMQRCQPPTNERHNMRSHKLDDAATLPSVATPSCRSQHPAAKQAPYAGRWKQHGTMLYNTEIKTQFTSRHQPWAPQPHSCQTCIIPTSSSLLLRGKASTNVGCI